MQDQHIIIVNRYYYGSKEKSKEKLKNTLRQMKMEMEHTKLYGMQQKQF